MWVALDDSLLGPGGRSFRRREESSACLGWNEATIRNVPNAMDEVRGGGQWSVGQFESL